MKILILVDTLNFGGAEKQAVLDANDLTRLGHDVTIAYFDPGALVNELVEGVEHVHINAKGWLGRIIAIRAFIRRCGIQVIHAHMFRAGVTAAFAGRLAGCTVVLNEHGLGINRSRLQRLLFRLSSILANEVWCASDACMQFRLSKESVSKGKLKVVYNCFTPFAAVPAKEVQKLRYSLAEEHAVEADKLVIVGYVGRFDPVKRLQFLVRAAEIMQQKTVLFVMVGDGIERETIEALIKQGDVAQCFHLPGFVHDPAIWYEAFDVFVLPSKRESLSMSLLEAGSKGVPAIAFDVGGNAEIIEHGGTGYVIPDDDIEEFAGRINELADEPSTRKRLGEAAARLIPARFSTEARMNELTTGYARHIRGDA